MKTRLKKIALIVAGCALLAVVTLMVLAKVLITEQRVRETVVPLVEENLHRKLQLGAIDIGLFSGIRLEQVVLFEADGTTEFVAADALELRYRLLPLLLLRVEVDRIALERPRLRLVRGVDGRFNFSDLAGDKGGAASVAPAPATEHQGGGSPLDLRVASFSLVDGALDYRDLSSKPAVEHRLSALQVTVRDFSLRERFPAELSADWNGNRIGLTGEFDLDDLAATATLNFNRLALLAAGDLLSEAKGERLRARLEIPRIALTDLVESLPKAYVSLPPDLKPGGELALNAELDGLLSEPLSILRSAQLQLFSASVRSGELQPELTGKLLIDGRKLSSDGLSLGLGGERLSLQLGSPDLLASSPALAVRLTGKRFDLDRALPKAPEQKAAASTQASATAAEELGPLSIPLQLTAEVKIEQLLTNGLSMQPLQLKLALRDNVLRLEELLAGIDAGRLAATARVDLGQKGLKYNGALKLQDLQVNPLVKAFKPGLGDSLFGVVDGTSTFSGRGTLPATVKKQLTADGDLALTDGRLKSLPVLDSTAALLGVPSLKEVTLDQGQVNFRLRDGKVLLDSQAGGSKLRSAINGSISLDGDLDLKVALGLGPELSQQLDRRGALSRALSDQQGWTTVPLKVTGRAAKPKVVPDTEALAKQAAGKALDRLGESLQKKLAPDGNGEASPEKEAVDAVLKGLLGR